MTIRRLTFVFVLAALSTAPLHARAATSSARAKIDATVLRAARTGFWSVGTLRPDVDRAPVVIRLAAPATPAVLAKLAAAGAELELDRGAPLAFERNVPAHVSERAALALAALPEVERVALAPTGRSLPMAHSSELLRMADARGARPALDLLTGAGVTVGDSDSLVDVFHPAMFRADAGYFDWIDVNRDGHFTPGVDAIDLNGDGVASDGETAMPLTAATYDWYGAVAARDASFDPGVDWLYLDTNGNGVRDYGVAAGFDDTTPAFGEPLFVPDDLDRSGSLDPGEKVVRLGTSKYKKVRVHVTYLAKVNHVYERGVDLSSTPVDLTHGKLYGFPDAYHATGVTSILAGDVPLAGRTWVGIAPDVDLVHSFDVDTTGELLPTAAATWLLAQGAEVMLYELAPWTGLPLDGTDPLSQIIDDSATKSGVAHACPTGDQGSARKHAHLSLGAGASGELGFDLPAHAKAWTEPLSEVELTAHVRGGDVASFTLSGPNGVSFALTDGATGALAGGASYYVSVQTTSRGTKMYDAYIYLSPTAPSTDALPVGAWTLAARGGATDVTVEAYLSDDKSSWAVGAAWDAAVATDAITIGVPSTADHCIAVGAMPDHVAEASTPWFDMTSYVEYDVPSSLVETQRQARAYSPLGPRIDGAQKPDVLAPDNPWAAAPHTTQDTYLFPHAAYTVFGGTSGAGPHVAGLAALLAQAGVKGDAARDAMRQGADVGDGKTPLPNAVYGYGALDAARALGVTSAGLTPTVSLKVDPPSPAVGATVTLTPVVSGGDGLEVKWDDDYDGTWDVGYAPAAPRAITGAQAGKRSFKARVRNASGHFAEAMTVVVFTPAGEATSSSKGCDCGASGRGGSLGAAGGLALATLAIVRRRLRARVKPARGALLAGR